MSVGISFHSKEKSEPILYSFEISKSGAIYMLSKFPDEKSSISFWDKENSYKYTEDNFVDYAALSEYYLTH